MGAHTTYMKSTALYDALLEVLSDIKAIDVLPLDVRHLTTVTDYMIIVSGRSSRHVQAIADHVVKAMKLKHHQPIRCETDHNNEWVLVDLGDIVLHIMQSHVRAVYQLEKLWATPYEKTTHKKKSPLKLEIA